MQNVSLAIVIVYFGNARHYWLEYYSLIMNLYIEVKIVSKSIIS